MSGSCTPPVIVSRSRMAIGLHMHNAACRRRAAGPYNVFGFRYVRRGIHSVERARAVEAHCWRGVVLPWDWIAWRPSRGRSERRPSSNAMSLCESTGRFNTPQPRWVDQVRSLAEVEICNDDDALNRCETLAVVNRFKSYLISLLVGTYSGVDSIL